MANTIKKNYVTFLCIILIFSFFSISNAQSDMDHEHPRGLNIPQDVKDYWKNRKTVQKSIQVQYPSSKDWKYKDSSVKNQYWCGSCWAFAAVALVENIGSKNDLSEQVLISCASGDCNGGWYGDALYYIQNNGLPPENCYPYQIDNGNCDDKCNTPDYLEKVAYADRWGRWGSPDENTVNDLKGLLQYSAVVVAMLVPEDGTFDSYSGGVYNYEGGYISGSNSHAVLVVGYNDDGEYFRCKNSWGKSWGESGYFKISYDDVVDNVEFGGYACIASSPYTEYPDPETISQPGMPNGEENPYRGTSYTYSTSGAISSLEHTVEYQFNWGDGSYSTWSTSTSASHAWSSDGEKSITVTARCQTHNDIQNTSDAFVVDVQAPVEMISKPGTPSGNSWPTRDVEYTYSTSGAISSFGHIVEYQFDWSDGSTSAWSTSTSASHAWSSNGSKNINVTARCQEHTDKSNISDALMVVVEDPEVISHPGKLTGESFPTRDVECLYTTSGAVSNLGHIVEYQFNWGDGSTSNWSTTKTASHAWSSIGNRSIFVTARCKVHNNKINTSDVLEVIVCEPEVISQPGTPSGEDRPTINIDYAYSTSGASSNLGHTVEYRFDWGDGSYSAWSTSKFASHSWSSLGDKNIKVYARCQTHTDKITESNVINIVVEAVEEISQPQKPDGNSYPTRGLAFLYTSGSARSNIEHALEYQFLWGDSTQTEWQTDSSASHIWQHNGLKAVVVQVRCIEHPDKNNRSDTLWVTVEDPEVISKSGKPTGSVEIVMETNGIYNCSTSISNLGHIVEYQFNWGDGEVSEWLSHPEAIHQWAEPGYYSVWTIARCQVHPEKYSVSDTLTVHVRYPPVTMILNTVPESLYLSIGDSFVQAPFEYTGYPEDSLNLHASARQGYWLFNHWSQGGDSTQNLMIPYSDSTYTAFYSLEQFALHVSVNDSIMGSVQVLPSDTLYDAEAEVILTATPNEKFYFSHWSGDLGSTQEIDTLIVNKYKTVMAHFKQIDDEPPFLYSFYPLPNCQEIPQNEVVQFKLSDSLSYVDLEQIQITLNQTVLFTEGINQQPGQLSVHSLDQGYWFIYQPDDALSQDSLVAFKVSCQDTAYIPNMMDTTITFQQGESQLSIFYTDTLSSSQITFNLLDSLSLTLRIDTTLIPDDLFIRLSLVNHYPPLPDTLDIVGQPIHLGPQGIHFESADSVQLLFQTQQGFEDSSLTLDYTIWYYSTKDSGWIHIPYTINGSSLQIHCSSSGYYVVALVIDEFIPQPYCPVGDTLIVTDSTYIYETYLMASNRGKSLEYSFNWGNGEFSQWSTDTAASYIWLEPGVYPVSVIARNSLDTTQIEYSDTLFVHVIDSKTGIESWLAIPDKFMMDPNYPNPFNPETTIHYGLPEADDIRLEIYNIMGQRVAVLLDEKKKAGYHQITWRGMNDSGHSVSSGIYFVVLRSSKKVLKQKVMLLR